MSNAQEQKAQPIEQASVIPFRWREGELEVCLITSVRRGRWLFPKGIIDPGETYVETGLKEAREEAGLLGQIVGDPIGRYEYAKWGTTLKVTVCLMAVERTEDEWEEAEIRQRRWVPVAEAEKMLENAQLLDLLASAVQRLSGGKSSG
ncbi:MAG: NUDIX domain-containing protein [Planctomycetales bacterium]|nr:NUDIX domain-containing protein [Planctomycetales bacterium]NIM08217.1 NUDIX domain-containing protein [Planctomycetales bacterium]NIN07711.1 NUDIX domain-containing protein [Planctomycetales bacterium]NIN76837.1 NUDIX domain-containing protein [Planctomycetales bacterium]NIO34033.1 NUDIX domain-containing protein [Planctomycetales bacterium]